MQLSDCILDLVFKEAKIKNPKPFSTQSHQRCFYRMINIDPFVIRTVSNTDWSYAWIWFHLHFTHEGFVWMAGGEERPFSNGSWCILIEKESQVFNSLRILSHRGKKDEVVLIRNSISKAIQFFKPVWKQLALFCGNREKRTLEKSSLH